MAEILWAASSAYSSGKDLSSAWRKLAGIMQKQRLRGADAVMYYLRQTVMTSRVVQVVGFPRPSTPLPSM